MQNLLPNEKLACITIDIELDYGDRTGEFNILQETHKELLQLAKQFKELNIPISLFICTNLLIKYPKLYNILIQLGDDFHCHSHTHNTKNFDSNYEISKSTETFYDFFGYYPIGYRAPQGVLYEGDIEILKQFSYNFSSSVFPSFRPGKFNNLSLPIHPFKYYNGIIELPLAVIPKLRNIISLSYLKLMGYQFYKNLFNILDIPNIFIFDSHLHDYILNNKSYQ